MNSGVVLLLSFGIGCVAGLRSLTAPAVVAWAAYLGWIDLQGSPLAFMESKWAVGIFTVLALVELVADQLPGTPARTAPVGLSARIVMGALAGACLAVAGSGGLWLGGFAGAIGGIAGAFAGYQARVGLVRKLRMKDFMVAIPEDLFAVGIGLILVTRF
jgi:uncharacterized membrane protein